MNKSVSHTALPLLAAMLSLSLLGGCATTDAEGISKAQATADQALQKANEANATANAAKATADQALQKANEANASAADARSAAEQANSTANAAKAEADRAMQQVDMLSEKTDRMFKKTMQK